MCGIFGYLGEEKKDLSNIILKGLKELEYRGYDSWGVAVSSGKKIFIHKKVGKIGEAKIKPIDSSVGIGHTRWATHGGVTETNAHPHLDCTGKIAVVHNGIVENFQELKQKLLKGGHKFVSETDTEVISHLLEEEIKEKEPLEAIRLVFSEIKGLNAIIAYVLEKNCFLVAKNSSPLILGIDKKGNYYLASDLAALVGLVDKVYYFKDDEVGKVDSKGFKLMNLKGEKIKPKFMKLTIDPSSVSLGKYKTYMEKEINEQPRVIENILRNKDEELEKFASLIKKAYGSYFIGCGTAFYAALTGTYLFSKIAKRHINAAVGSEFSYLLDFIKKESLVIALSQSGETIDVISTIKKVKEKGAKVVAITNVLGSTLYRLADFKILLTAGPEKCVLATKSFTAKIAILYLTSHILAGTLDKGKKNLKRAVKELKKVISNSKEIKRIAKRLVNKEHIFVLGRGVSYPLALESALKIKEVSYIHAEGFPAGELKHGVIALIEKGTPVIVYNPEDETYEDTLSSAYEVKSRGAYVIGVSSKKDSVYDKFIQIENCGDAVVIPSVAIAQLLGYHLALQKGYDPDKPRNLAKSVTVK